MEVPFSPHREDMLAHVQEVALRSAYAHGKTLTDFAFALPRHDDVVTLPHGGLVLRMDTEDSGYSLEEEALHDALFPTPLLALSSLPSSFVEHTDVIALVHTEDLEEIVRGLIRYRASVTRTILQDFATCSMSLHEAFLALVHDLSRIDSPAYAEHILRTTHPAYLHTQDAFLLALRRIRHDAFIETATRGALDQYQRFLHTGLATGFEKNFFEAQLTASHL